MEKIPFIKGTRCAKCGIPLKISYPLKDIPYFLCGNCRIAPPLFDRALSVCLYHGIVKDIISAYKYQNKPSLGYDLVSMILNSLKEGIIELSPGLIIPVPLHRKRLKERGYDQASLLAFGIGRQLNIPVSFENLIRTRYTIPQVNLSGYERTKNVRGAFSIRDNEELKDKVILLIDDVLTTGATIKECVKLMRGASADKIHVLTFARA